jgi:hypothetical protein
MYGILEVDGAGRKPVPLMTTSDFGVTLMILTVAKLVRKYSLPK